MTNPFHPLCLANFPAHFKAQLKYRFLTKGFSVYPLPIRSDSSILCLFLHYANPYYNSHNDSFKHMCNAYLPSRT